jgi:hypothetical protein
VDAGAPAKGKGFTHLWFFSQRWSFSGFPYHSLLLSIIIPYDRFGGVI